MNENLANVHLKFLHELLILLLDHPIRPLIGHLPVMLMVDGLIKTPLKANSWEVIGKDILKLLKDVLGLKGHT